MQTRWHAMQFSVIEDFFWYISEVFKLTLQTSSWRNKGLMKQTLPCFPWVIRGHLSWVPPIWVLLVDATGPNGPFWMSIALGVLQKSNRKSKKKNQKLNTNKSIKSKSKSRQGALWDSIWQPSRNSKLLPVIKATRSSYHKFFLVWMLLLNEGSHF